MSHKNPAELRMLAVVTTALLFVLEGCVSLAPSSSSSASASASAVSASDLPSLAPATPRPTRQPCQQGDTRPRCQTPTPIPPSASPTDSPSMTPTDTPTPTLPPTGTPIPMPTGSTGGTPTDIAISTLQINFGNVASGTTSAPMSVTLTNTGTDPFGPINIFGGAPPSNEFNASQNCQGGTLAAGASCMVNYTFSPPAPGYYSDFSSFTISETTSQSDGEDFSVAIFGCGETC